MTAPALTDLFVICGGVTLVAAAILIAFAGYLDPVFLISVMNTALLCH
jgi:hypothetical protein